MINKIFLDLFTGEDNDTHDIGRYFAALFGVMAIFFEGWDVIVQNHTFSIQEFGIGTGALALGLGAMLKLKENTEPHKCPPNS
jgi:SAM-dependent MidA family methyltransferase